MAPGQSTAGGLSLGGSGQGAVLGLQGSEDGWTGVPRPLPPSPGPDGLSAPQASSLERGRLVLPDSRRPALLHPGQRHSAGRPGSRRAWPPPSPTAHRSQPSSLHSWPSLPELLFKPSVVSGLPSSVPPCHLLREALPILSAWIPSSCHYIHLLAIRLPLNHGP